MGSNDLPVVALTMGDAAGIGPEITAKFITAARKEKNNPTLLILGDERLLEDNASLCKVELGDVNVITKAVRDKLAPGSVNLLQLKTPSFKDVKPGQPTAKTGRAAMGFLEKATELALLKDVDAIVTCPISKKAINEAGYHFAGHTDFFAEKTNTSKYAMCFVADDIRTAIVTGHAGLRKVHSKVKLARVLRTVSLFDGFLRTLGVAAPKIAVTGLNPHAGESGLLGSEEYLEIAPAVEAARAQGINATGPVSAEAAFLGHFARNYDGVVAMYHDQGILPVKALAPFKAINVTLGLPFVRTSVGHGAAFDIAGQGIARADSLRNAVVFAAKLVRPVRKY